MNNFLLKNSILVVTSVAFILINQNRDSKIDDYIDCKIKETINCLKNAELKKQDYHKIIYSKKKIYMTLVQMMMIK